MAGLCDPGSGDRSPIPCRLGRTAPALVLSFPSSANPAASSSLWIWVGIAQVTFGLSIARVGMANGLCYRHWLEFFARQHYSAGRLPFESHCWPAQAWFLLASAVLLSGD